MIFKKKEVILTSDGQSLGALLDSAKLAAQTAEELNEKGDFDGCRWYIRAAKENLSWALKKVPYNSYSAPDYKELCLENIDDRVRAAADSCTEDEIERYLGSARTSLDVIERSLLKAISKEHNYALCDGFPGAPAQVTWFGLRKDALKAGQERWDSLSDEVKRYAWEGVSFAVVDAMSNVVKDWSAEEMDRAFNEQGEAARAELREKVANEEDGYTKVPAWRMAFHLPWERSGFYADKWVRDPETAVVVSGGGEYPEGISVDLMSILEASPLEEDKVLLEDMKNKKGDDEDKEE